MKNQEIIENVFIAIFLIAVGISCLYVAKETYPYLYEPSSPTIGYSNNNNSGLAQISDDSVDIIIQGEKWRTVSCDGRLKIEDPAVNESMGCNTYWGAKGYPCYEIK